jgi:hypothetical protein
MKKDLLISGQDNYAEDELEIISLKYDKRRIVSIEDLNPNIKIIHESDSYSVPDSSQDKKIIKISLIKQFKNLKSKLTLSLIRERRIRYLHIISKKNISNYFKLIEVIKSIDDSKTDYILVIDWQPNYFEEFILQDFKYAVTSPFDVKINSLNHIPKNILFFANHFKMNLITYETDKNIIFRKVIDNKEINKYIETEINKNSKFNIIINSKFPLENKYKGIVNADRPIWSSKLFGKHFSETFNDAYLIYNESTFSFDILDSIVKYKLCLINSNQINCFRNSLRVNLPGLLIPNNVSGFDDLMSRSINEGKCYKVRSQGLSNVEIHKCFDSYCKIEDFDGINFYHYQSMFPKFYQNGIQNKLL